MQSCTLVWPRSNSCRISRNSILVLHLWPFSYSLGMRGRASTCRADFRLGWISMSKSNWSRSRQPSFHPVFQCFENTLTPSLRRLLSHQLMNYLQYFVSKRSCFFWHYWYRLICFQEIFSSRWIAFVFVCRYPKWCLEDLNWHLRTFRCNQTLCNSRKLQFGLHWKGTFHKELPRESARLRCCFHLL